MLQSVLGDKLVQVLKLLGGLLLYDFFYLYHAHANTEGGPFYIEWFTIPDILELTFIIKKIVETAESSKVIFQTNFDRPNVNDTN